MSCINDKAAWLALGKAQLDAMFERKKLGPRIDDSRFIPLVEAVLMAFEKMGLDPAGVDELWEYAYSAYDRACYETDPLFPPDENRQFMQSHLCCPRKPHA